MSDVLTLNMRSDTEIPIDFLMFLDEDNTFTTPDKRHEQEDGAKMQVDQTDLVTNYLNDAAFFMPTYKVEKSPLSEPGSPSSNGSCQSPGIGSTSDVLAQPSPPPTVKQKIPRHKRQSHIKAEHKRRNKIQTGFNDLKELIPAIRDSGSSNGIKDSKAAMLSKTVAYCRQLRVESEDTHKDLDALREEISTLTAEINNFQQKLPASGAMIRSQAAPGHKDGMDGNAMVEDYIKARTFQNWKFWIFSMIMRPLWESFELNVSTASNDSFSQSVMNWIQNHCSLVSLRPILLSTLRQLSTQTSIMTQPEQLPSEALQYVIQDTFQTNAAKPDRFQGYRRSGLGSGQVTPLSSGYRTPLSSGQMTPLSSGQLTPLSSGQITPLSSGQQTPLSSGHVTPLSSGHVTPLSSGQLTPLSSGQLTPLSSGQLTPQHLSSGQCTPVSSSHRAPVSAHGGHYTPPLNSGQTTPVAQTSPFGSINSTFATQSPQTVHMSGSISPLHIFPTNPSRSFDVTMSPVLSASPAHEVPAACSPSLSTLPSPDSSTLTSHSLSFTQEFCTLSSDSTFDLLFSTPSMSCS